MAALFCFIACYLLAITRIYLIKLVEFASFLTIRSALYGTGGTLRNTTKG